MANTIIEICNSALTKIGAESILSFEDGTKSSLTCKERFESCKKYVLRRHPWNCATKRKKLSPLTLAPEFGWTYKFQLPSDCLRVLVVNDGDTEYSIEGRELLADENVLELKYIWDVSDPKLFDSVLDEAIAAYLAWDISYKITQSHTLKETMMRDFRDALRKAKTPDAQEEPAKELTADYYLDSRQAGSSAIPKRNWIGQ
jgi:hypothetical protein